MLITEVIAELTKVMAQNGDIEVVARRQMKVLTYQGKPVALISLLPNSPLTEQQICDYISPEEGDLNIVDLLGVSVPDRAEYDVAVSAANQGYGIDTLRNGIKIYWRLEGDRFRVTNPDGTIIPPEQWPPQVIEQMNDPVGDVELRQLTGAEVEEHTKIFQ